MEITIKKFDETEFVLNCVKIRKDKYLNNNIFCDKSDLLKIKEKIEEFLNEI